MPAENITDPRTTESIPRLALRRREAAAALGVSERTLWTWTQAGDVPHVRRGSTIMYPVAALEAWLAQAQGAEGGTR